MSMTLRIDGRDYTEEELVRIVQKYLSSNGDISKADGRTLDIITKRITICHNFPSNHSLAKIPTEGEWFEVRPKDIDQRKFELMEAECESDICNLENETLKLYGSKSSEEWGSLYRKLLKKKEILGIIIEAFHKHVNNSSEHWRKPFYTTYPSMQSLESMISKEEKKSGIRIISFDYLATNIEKGCYLGNWVAQGLEWAQRISNGEILDELLFNTDTANSCRAVLWKDGYIWRIGGCKEYKASAMNAELITKKRGTGHDRLKYAVPYIIRYLY